MTYTIAEPCIDIKDRSCVDECPVDCIYEGPRMLYIQPDECVDCGACEPACPVTAIFYEDDVPGEWKQFTPVNAEFFNDSVSGLGSPGGAAQVGPAAVDHPVVADILNEILSLSPVSEETYNFRCENSFVTIRQNGITKIWTGVLMVCVPVGGWIGFNAIHFMPMKIFGFMCMIGLWGAYRIVKGIIMVISPKTEPGDVASQ